MNDKDETIISSPSHVEFVNGIVEEILACEKLCDGIALKFKGYLTVPELEDAVDGFLQTETDPEVRKTRILKAFKTIAAFIDC